MASLDCLMIWVARVWLWDDDITSANVCISSIQGLCGDHAYRVMPITCNIAVAISAAPRIHHQFVFTSGLYMKLTC